METKTEIEKIEYMLNEANPPLRTIERSFLQAYLNSIKKENKIKREEEVKTNGRKHKHRKSANRTS